MKRSSGIEFFLLLKGIKKVKDYINNVWEPCVHQGNFLLKNLEIWRCLQILLTSCFYLSNFQCFGSQVLFSDIK